MKCCLENHCSSPFSTAVTTAANIEAAGDALIATVTTEIVGTAAAAAMEAVAEASTELNSPLPLPLPLLSRALTHCWALALALPCRPQTPHPAQLQLLFQSLGSLSLMCHHVEGSNEKLREMQQKIIMMTMAMTITFMPPPKLIVATIVMMMLATATTFMMTTMTPTTMMMLMTTTLTATSF